MATICQIGCGMIGKVMALDISKRHDLHLSDLNQSSLYEVKALDPTIKTKCFNFNNINILKSFLEPADIVLVSVPGHLGYNLLKTIIGLKKNIVDISFSPENLLSLDKMAKQNGVTVVFDAGLAPGIPNFLLGNISTKENVKKFKYLVGGLPKNPTPPYNYKAPFSPIDVVEEYTRPARIMKNGRVIIKPALTDIEQKYYPKIGMFEGFNTDGLRSILSTMKHIPNMVEKTLRFPGHAQLINEEIESGKIRPGDQNNLERLFELWKMSPDELEFTVLDVIIETETRKHNYFLYDETNLKENITSMGRTTGYTATAVIDILDQNIFMKKGAFPPELVGSSIKVINHLLNHLKERNIKLKKLN
tara:strand:- start:112 stop:1194 length:1083 start_codon:yes stop_codon:yes gene_type:complete